jgi:hypothetical protein
VDVGMKVEEAPERLDRRDATRPGVVVPDRLAQCSLDDAVGGERELREEIADRSGNEASGAGEP